MEPPRDVPVLVAALVGALALVAATGVAAAFLYAPDPGAAHAAVAATPSWLRSAHAWGASLAVALALVLAWRMFVLGSYARGATLGVVALLGLLLAAFESGVVLPWDQRAWEAWWHVRETVAVVGPELGSPDEPARTPLTLVFGAHLALGAASVAGAGVAAWRGVQVQVYLHRLAPPAGAAIALALLLALLLPAAHGPAPVLGLFVSRPHWPFLWLVPLQDRWGVAALLALPLLLAAGALLAWRPPQRRAVRVGLVAAVALALALLTLAGGRA